MAAVGWEAARAAATSAGSPGHAVLLPIELAVGSVTAAALVSGQDLPGAATAAMDGWAVAGPPPWQVLDLVVPAGPGAGPVALEPGQACQVSTGAALPRGTGAVLRRERGVVAGPHLYGGVSLGADVRPRGQECRAGEEILPAGVVVTPVVLGLAASAGVRDLLVVRRPQVDLLVIGDELRAETAPGGQPGNDALGPMLPGWLTAYGAEVGRVIHLPDSATALRAALSDSAADLVVTTGGTAAGPDDHVRPVLTSVGALLVVDGVAVRPGHPMLMARLASGAVMVGLPGNPLAAVSGMVTLVEPLVRVMTGRVPTAPRARVLAAMITAHPSDTRLAPVLGDRPLHFAGPGMLRGLAAADGLAVVPPASNRRDVEVLALPW